MRRLRRWAVAALVLPALMLAGLPLWMAEIETAPAEPARPTDAIVVLTGGADRVGTALSLLDAGLAPRLLVSGVAAGLTAAELARAHGRDAAALDRRVTLGHAAATTVGNAAETAAWARAQGLPPTASLRVVTAAYHMPRALVELGRAMPQARLVAHPVTPAVQRDLSWARTLRLQGGEYVKWLLARLGLTVLVPAREAVR
ncbi:YdcF family protein [Falsiroseomonas sp. HW251]|uniref:YdcF family protein n=1 Tax=Falsiroseomonas sp. HW251 TaxID=3390998 RepID=UPI003D31EA5D